MDQTAPKSTAAKNRMVTFFFFFGGGGDANRHWMLERGPCAVPDS
jgi:hypothetical protein